MPNIKNIRARPFAFILFFYVAWIIRLIALPLIDPAKTAFLDHLIFGATARLIIWCFLPALWICLVERRTIASAVHPVEQRSLRLALILTVMLAVLLLFGMKATRGHWLMIPPGHNALEYVGFALAVGLLALGEEFTFRGVFLSGLLRSGMPFWGANAIVAAAFALSHWPGWFMFGGIGFIDLLTATTRLLVFGLVMGGLVRIEGGIVAAITIHAFNDGLVGTLL